MEQLRDYATSVNKAIGAVIGGGLITLLVSLHVISPDAGATTLAIITGVAGVLGAFLAPSNKPLTLVKDDDMGAGSIEDEDLAA